MDKEENLDAPSPISVDGTGDKIHRDKYFSEKIEELKRRVLTPAELHAELQILVIEAQKENEKLREEVEFYSRTLAERRKDDERTIDSASAANYTGYSDLVDSMVKNMVRQVDYLSKELQKTKRNLEEARKEESELQNAPTKVEAKKVESTDSITNQLDALAKKFTVTKQNLFVTRNACCQLKKELTQVRKVVWTETGISPDVDLAPYVSPNTTWQGKAKKIEMLEQKIQELRKQLKCNKSVKDDDTVPLMKETVKERRKKQDELASQIKTLKKENDELAEKINHLKSRMTALTKTIAEQRDKIKNSVKSRELTNKKIIDLKNELQWSIEKWKGLHAVSTDKLRRMVEVRDQLLHDEALLNARIQALQEELNNMHEHFTQHEQGVSPVSLEDESALLFVETAAQERTRLIEGIQRLFQELGELRGLNVMSINSLRETVCKGKYLQDTIHELRKRPPTKGNELDIPDRMEKSQVEDLLESTLSRVRHEKETLLNSYKKLLHDCHCGLMKLVTDNIFPEESQVESLDTEDVDSLLQ